MSQIRISGKITDSITDGPGIRYVLFTQGCPHNCFGCHNPHTHSYEGGKLVSSDSIFNEIKKNKLLTGVTFSGGEPFCQAEQLLDLAKKIKENNLELAIYSGYTFEELINKKDNATNQLLSFCDVLIDGRFVKNLQSYQLKFKGSSNQNIIDVGQSLKQNKTILNTSPRWN